MLWQLESLSYQSYIRMSSAVLRLVSSCQRPHQATSPPIIKVHMYDEDYSLEYVQRYTIRISFH